MSQLDATTTEQPRDRDLRTAGAGDAAHRVSDHRVGDGGEKKHDPAGDAARDEREAPQARVGIWVV